MDTVELCPCYDEIGTARWPSSFLFGFHGLTLHEEKHLCQSNKDSPQSLS